MIKNYFKTAFRSLWRNKGFTAINMAGLAIGIATCLIILLFVQHELSYDRYAEKADRIVRVIFRGQVKGEKMKEANVFPPVAQALVNDYPEVEEATRISFGGSPIVLYNNKTFKENSFAYADSNFFHVFTIPFLQGHVKTALIEPNSMVISKQVAIKYFGNEDPMGKLISFKDGNQTWKITGVIDKIPENSHFHFDMFASMSSLDYARSDSWMSSGMYTYLVLRKGYDYKELEAKLPQTVKKYMEPQLQRAMSMNLQQFRASGNDLGLFLQPLTSIHLHSDLTGDFEPAGDIRYVYIFSAIALFMLLIACINFMNLSTASAGKRAREVGIRKVMGSLKGHLVWQFLMESLLLTAVALVLAIVLVQLALPLFNQLAGKELTLRVAGNPWLIPGLLGLGVLTGILAGSYPAFFLSSFNPVTVLKGIFTSGKKSISLRSGLVVFQFFISITLMVSTAVVYKQLSYIQHKKLGYDKEQVLILPETWRLGNKAFILKQQLQQDPRVASVTASFYLPAGPSNGNNFFVYEHSSASQIKTLRYEVDYDYIPTLGMQMEAGRNFSKEYGTDSNAVILNESAVRAMGWKNENALGKTISRADISGAVTSWRVIGIVKDFHFRSLHERISPLVMTLNTDYGTLIIKTKTANIAGLLASTKANWERLGTDATFSYTFLNEEFNKVYHAEQNTGSILGIFALLTIFVACLGLFGLATFTARQRNKEIGIRKVLGASVTSIVSMLSKDFLKLIVLAFIIAAPVAWFVMNQWLQDFAYRITITWWIFLLVAVAAILFTLVTVSIQAIKAALANPVYSLRSE